MFLNIIELVLVAIEVFLLVVFFVILKKNGEKTIEEVKGNLLFLAKAMLVNGILISVIAVINSLIRFIK